MFRPPLHTDRQFLTYFSVRRRVPVLSVMSSYILYPSSISLPKEGTNSYGIYENDCFTIKTFDNEIVKQIQLD